MNHSILRHALLAAPLLAASVLAFAPPAHAQRPDTLGKPITAPEWRAGVLATYEAVGNDLPDWHTVSASLGRKTPAFSWNAEVLEARRFEQSDVAGVLDLYADLWRGAYGNVRVQAAPEATILPGADVSLNVFQAVARVWEVGAGYRGLWFEDDRVNLLSASLARYAGNYFLQGRATAVPKDGRVVGSVIALARRYYATADDFAEVLAGTGSEVVTIGVGPQIDVRRSTFVAARLQRRVRGPFTLTAGAGYTDDEVFSRWSVTAGAGVRW